MAIAFDATSKSYGSSITSLTWAHSCGGTDRYLVVDVTSPFTDTLTGVTYNGVSMTLLGKVRSTANNGWCYTYVLINPASGSNNVVVSSSSSASLDACATSFTGVNQSVGYDTFVVTAEQNLVTYTQSATVINASCWLHGFFVTNTGQTQSTGYTIRNTADTQRWTTGDSNGVVATGSQSMASTTTNASARNWVGTIIALRPSLPTFIPRPRLF